MDKIMETLKKYRNKTSCVGCSERSLVVRILRHSFVCLRGVMQVSVHYILCLVAVHMKLL